MGADLFKNSSDGSLEAAARPSWRDHLTVCVTGVCRKPVISGQLSYGSASFFSLGLQSRSPHLALPSGPRRLSSCCSKHLLLGGEAGVAAVE